MVEETSMLESLAMKSAPQLLDEIAKMAAELSGDLEIMSGTVDVGVQVGSGGPVREKLQQVWQHLLSARESACVIRQYGVREELTEGAPCPAAPEGIMTFRQHVIKIA